MVKILDRLSSKLFLVGLIATAALMPADLLTEGSLGVEKLVLVLLGQRAALYIALNASSFPAVRRLLASSLQFALPVVAGVITAVFAINPGIAFAFVLLFGVVAARGWLISAFTDKEGLRLFEFTTIIVAGLVVLFGYYQFFGDLLGLPGDATFLIDRYRSGTTFAFPRVHSIALEPLYLANYLFLPIGLMLIRLKRRASRWEAGFLVLSLALFFSTVSRGAVGGLLLASGMLIFVFRTDRRFLKVAGFAMLCSVLLVLLMMRLPDIVEKRGGLDDSFADHLIDLDDASALTRFELWPRAFRSFAEDPLTGAGPDNARLVLQREKYTGEESYDELQPINNDYVTILTEMGILGLLAFLPLAWSLWRKLLQLLRAGFDHLSAPYMFALIGTAVQANTFGVLPLMRTWVVIGMIFAGWRIARTEKPKK